LRFVAAALALSACSGWCGQQGGELPQAPSEHQKQAEPLPQHLPPKASQAPSFSIPVAPLGFTVPGAESLGRRWSLATLDFMDEDRLLFTFRVPGLIRRGASDADLGDERQIRAVELALPSGAVLSEAVWKMHGRSRYLWMLKDGHFLLRDGDMLERGNASLELEPLFRFPGPLTWVEMDPGAQYIVTNSLEREEGEARQKGEPDRGSNPGSASARMMPDTAQASITVDGEASDSLKEIVVRILRRETGKVMLVSRSRSSVHLPINADGYVESLRGADGLWVATLDYFRGGNTILGRVESACVPNFDFISQREVLATTCDRGGGRRWVGMATDGRRLWQVSKESTPIWPILVKSPDGSRLAMESLAVTHPVNASMPLDGDDIKGQVVEVFDAATGRLALTASASPVLDGGGNVAISPSGRRVAVLSDGAIQVFDLPEPPGSQ
jgi:hypothetical protein